MLAAGVPHTPYFPRLAKDPSSTVSVNFRRVAERVRAARLDALVIFDTDHMVNFFLDTMPTFAVGTARSADGPHELGAEIPFCTVAIAQDLARGLLAYGVRSGFDLASCDELKLDHSTLVPLHFTLPEMDVPIVPVFVRGINYPLPTARRCYRLGSMLRRFVASRRSDERIGVFASGSISLEVGGPWGGRVDREWIARVCDLMREGRYAEIVRAATPAQLWRAGNIGGEILNWIALFGVVGEARPVFVEPVVEPPDQPRDGHAYAVWELG